MQARRPPVARLVPVIISLLAAVSLCADARAAAPQRVDMPYSMIVSDLGGGRYRLEVDNTNPTKFIKTFTWTAPAGMNITGITNTVGGKCALSQASLRCTSKAKGLTPALCNCAGGAMFVIFTATGREPTFANGYWTHYGVIGSIAITGTNPAPSSVFTDLPRCKSGQSNTKAHPCADV